MFYVGTNDTSTNESLKIIRCIEENLGNMKSSFPEAEISVSKGIPQKSLKLFHKFMYTSERTTTGAIEILGSTGNSMVGVTDLIS